MHNFRNVEFADIQLEHNSMWIHGKNAQGKTKTKQIIKLSNLFFINPPKTNLYDKKEK